MRKRSNVGQPEIRQSLVESYAVNDRMNQRSSSSISSRAWPAKPDGRNRARSRRSFPHAQHAAQVAKARSAPDIKSPAQAYRTAARSARRRRPSPRALCVAQRCCGSPERAGEPRTGFLRDGWAKPWPAGAVMFAFMIAHYSHHRGQICMLARSTGATRCPSRYAGTRRREEALEATCGFSTVRRQADRSAAPHIIPSQSDRKNDSMERRASSPAGRASCERRDALRESPLTAKLAKKGRKRALRVGLFHILGRHHLPLAIPFHEKESVQM